MYGYPVSLKAFASVLLVHILIYIVEDVSMYAYLVSLKAFASVLLVHTLIYISWRM